jgi:glycosyltransferase involved in cell wall biosynthesis
MFQSRLRPYLFALGADDPRKNTQRLVRAYLSLLEEYDIEEDLVISGYTNWKSSEAYRLVVKADATQRVRFLSYVSLDELVMLYRNARLFVYPSLYEGFGIPLLEAFSSGCPVVASNVTSIPEVAGNAAFYVDPNSQDEIAEAIFRLIKDDELRISLSESGHQRAEQFSWRETAKKTLAVYKESMSRAIERGPRK